MTKTKMPILELVAASSLATIAFTVILLLFPSMNTEVAAAWAGAFGAFLAFLGTIYLATQETRRRKREAHVRAQIAAPGFAMKLSTLRPVIVQAIKILSSENPIDKETLHFCGSLFHKVQFWTNDDIEPIACLPNGCAINLAMLKEITEMVRRALDDPTDDPMKFVGEMVTQLHTALIILDMALNECYEVYGRTKYGVR